MTRARSKNKSKAAAAFSPTYDLVVLVADKDTGETIDGLLTRRTESLRIRKLTHVIISHPQHDPGCLNQSAALLSVYLRDYRHALVIFDRDGSGREGESREGLETTVEADLKKAGWDNRAAVIVIDPELENWVWGSSPHVARCLGWNNLHQSLQAWLVENGFLPEAVGSKPERPKEAMSAVLRTVRRPRSSAIYRAIAEKVRLEPCTDPAFRKLRETLNRWFAGTSV